MIMTSSYKTMKQKTMLKREYQNEQEWLKNIFRKSNSHGSRNRAETSLQLFDRWCKSKLELPDPDIRDLEVEYQKNMKGLWSKVNPNLEAGKLRWKLGRDVGIERDHKYSDEVGFNLHLALCYNYSKLTNF